MGLFGKKKGPKSVEELISDLNPSAGTSKSAKDGSFGYAGVEKAIDQLETRGDPSAIPVLLAKQHELDGVMAAMFVAHQGYPMGPDAEYRYVSRLHEKVKRVIAILQTVASKQGKDQGGLRY